MPLTYEIWHRQLLESAIQDFFFSPEAAALLAPAKRPTWVHYYEDGFGPQAALEEDLDIEVCSWS
jgi:hypothetical protein